MRKRKIASPLLVLILAPLYGQPGYSARMDPDHRYAWSENAGWLSHRETVAEVQVYSDHLEGYAWAESIGWIRFGSHVGGGSHVYANHGADDWGVNRHADGGLSGFAWAENIGWIDFAPSFGGVSLESGSGRFLGYAWSEAIGWIRFGDEADGYHAALAVSDLAIAQQADVGPLRAGSDLTYAMTITNLGDNDAEAVTSRFNLAKGVSLVSVEGDCLEGNDGVPECSLGALAPDASRSYAVSVRIAPSTSGELVSPVEVAALNGDPDLGNNRASVTTTVPVDWDNDGLPDAWDAFPEAVHANACSESRVEFENWIIRSGDVVVCRAGESIQVAAGVRVEAGGTLALVAPRVGVNPGFEAHSGGRLRAFAGTPVESPSRTKREVPRGAAESASKASPASAPRPLAARRLAPAQLPAGLRALLGDDGVPERAVSDDAGHYVVFASEQALLPADDNGSDDIYLYDVRAETLLLVSKSVRGAVGNGVSQDPAIDAQGGYIVFSSSADNLMDGDGNGVSDIYLYYIDFDYLARVSLSAEGERERPSYRPAMDAQGVQVLYEHGAVGERVVMAADPLQPYLGGRVVSGSDADRDFHHPGISASGRHAAWIAESANACGIVINDLVDGVVHEEACPFGDGVQHIDPPWFDGENRRILWRVSYRDESVGEYAIDYGDAD